MNGFTVVESEGAWNAPDERRYTVESPKGEKHEVLVQIDEEAVGYVERMIGGAYPRKLVLDSASSTTPERLPVERRESAPNQKADCQRRRP